LTAEQVITTSGYMSSELLVTFQPTMKARQRPPRRRDRSIAMMLPAMVL
jgi:hypothetical protein